MSIIYSGMFYVTIGSIMVGMSKTPFLLEKPIKKYQYITIIIIFKTSRCNSMCSYCKMQFITFGIQTSDYSSVNYIINFWISKNLMWIVYCTSINIYTNYLQHPLIASGNFRHLIEISFCSFILSILYVSFPFPKLRGKDFVLIVLNIDFHDLNSLWLYHYLSN